MLWEVLTTALAREGVDCTLPLPVPPPPLPAASDRALVVGRAAEEGRPPPGPALVGANKNALVTVNCLAYIVKVSSLHAALGFWTSQQ